MPSIPPTSTSPGSGADSGSLGFYPWIDRERDAFGIVEVEDTSGSDGRAVRASQAIACQAIAATPSS
ncbi:MAG: hypothetical protein HYX32_04495 [Actinobacteria bacterium]|nr:hypothetical protein [Actinomycetota bacterium]